MSGSASDDTMTLLSFPPPHTGESKKEVSALSSLADFTLKSADGGPRG